MTTLNNKLIIRIYSLIHLKCYNSLLLNYAMYKNILIEDFNIWQFWAMYNIFLNSLFWIQNGC